MKKLIVFLLCLALSSASAFAFQPSNLPYGVGAKYGAMGGAGSALCDDLTSTYYNPAGILKANLFEAKVAAGGATDGLNEIYKVISAVEDPEKFLSENFVRTFNLNGSLNIQIGVNLNKVGLSSISVGYLNLTKPTPLTMVGGKASGIFIAETSAVLGYSFSTPALPVASIDTGVNIKSINSFSSVSTAVGQFESNEEVRKGAGMGFDAGARAGINTAWPTHFAVVIRDVGSTLNEDVTTKVTTYDATGAITDQTSSTAPGGSTTSPTTLTLGVATRIPVVDLVLAADIDSVSGSGTSYSVTHLGVEYPIAGGFAKLRGGLINGGPNDSISMATMGYGIGFFNGALMLDSKNAKNNSMIFDFSIVI